MEKKYDNDLRFLEELGNDQLKALFNFLMYNKNKKIDDDFCEFWERATNETNLHKKNNSRVSYKKMLENISKDLKIEDYTKKGTEELEGLIYEKIFEIIKSKVSENEIEKMIFDPLAEEEKLKNLIFLHEHTSLDKISFLYLVYAMRQYNPEIITDFLRSPFMAFLNDYLKDDVPIFITRLMISFTVLISILRRIRKVFDKKKAIQESFVCEIKKAYKNVSLFQLELLELFENLKIIDESTQNKILKIIRISECFEGTVNGYYIKIEYFENDESIVKIVKII